LPTIGNPFSWEADAQQVMQSLNTQTTDWLVVDHYGIDSRWETLLRNSTDRIAVIDDLANRPHDCDAIIDQNYRLDFANRYDQLVPDGCIKLLGPRYLLLRPEFAKARQNLKRDFSAVRRILVNFGGTDEPNMSLRALQAIQSLNLAGLLVDVVIGQTNPHKAALQLAIKQMPGVTLHVQTDRMAELVCAADLAIGASGSSTWERCSLGLPTLALVLADNQREAAGELGAAGIIVNLGESNITTQQLAAEVDRLMKDPALRASLSKRSMQLIAADQASLPQLLMRTGKQYA
jgi:UDP-2,4-diacetamido-2,4,6-trideoxy-beta-L-altropyranose hydrolase